MNNIRGSHVSPGIYMKEIDVTYAPKSMGITTLGLAGETLKGPAFQPVSISDWDEFKEYFGGTSAEKVSDKEGNKVAKYELPYIAKEYLKESKQLEVTRVLGLSGYNAGPAWALSINKAEKSPIVFGLLRSKASINEQGDNICVSEEEKAGLDCATFKVKDINLTEITGTTYTTNCSTGALEEKTGEVDPRRFNMKVTFNNPEIPEKNYVISLRPSDPEYILKVLGTSATKGNADVFVEEFYERTFEDAWDNFKGDQNIESCGITIKATAFPSVGEKSFVWFATADAKGTPFTEEDLGKQYLGEQDCQVYEVQEKIIPESHPEPGASTDTDPSQGKKSKQAKTADTKKEYKLEVKEGEIVKSDELQMVDGKLYKFNKNKWDLVEGNPKMSNYMSPFRWATTPWFVSDARGNGKDLDVRRLFRLHTISDGNAANTHIKVSITNIDPTEGTFDVVIRDFFDNDANPVILERFADCTMDPMSPNYIALRIGTIDNTYELRSKYVMAEVIDNEELYATVPAGFLGYPMRNYGPEFARSEFSYNLTVRPELKAKRQYFGVSDINGEIDSDAFQYKGEENNPDNGAILSPGFHLDERLSLTGDSFTVTVDGVAVDNEGIIPPFKTPSSIGTKYTKPGIIFTKESMKDTIYEDKAMRKFTVCPFGGFDGWDIYREHRTNSDEYRFDRYVGGFYTTGLPENVFYPNPSRANKSDYYAFLCGYYTFSNPEEVDINLFATPGIDWKHNTELVKDTIDMIEDFEEGRGGDTFYTINSPESVEGAVNAADTADSLVEQLEMTGIDTSYAGTFWPWIKYYDASERTYVDLPVTKDLVRNFAYIDNNLYPWFAPAGKTERGNVDCVRATYATRINEEDILYKGLINPVKTFAVDGVKIWGNKTLYSVDSPLNRINVRRLMIRIKKLISRACSTLIFEPNDMKVRNQFLSIVSPILEDVRSNRGITDFKIEVDNSVEAIDEHVLPAKIWIKPTPTLEYIELTFVITPQGASFTE